METVSIRNLRGAALREIAGQGKLLGITDRRALIAVVVPVATAWVEHLVRYSWPRVSESIAEGEQAITGGTPWATIDDLAPESETARLDMAVVGNTVAQTPESRVALARLHALLSPPELTAARAAPPAESAVQAVRIGDLSAHVIAAAGRAGHTLAITHDRELIGIVIPVTTGLVELLIEQNINRVLDSVGLGEKQLATPDQLTTLDQALGRSDVSGTAE